MQCREVQTTLSSMADRQPIGAAELAEVRDHCRRCADCAAFASAIATIRRAKPPRLPRGLAKRIVTVVTEEMDAEKAKREEEAAAIAAAALAEAAPVAEAADAPPPETVGARKPGDLSIAWLSRERLWTVIAAVGTSAAVVLLAIVVSGQLSGQASIDKEAQEAVSRSLAPGGQGQAADQAPLGGTAAAPANAPATAPPFVAFGGKVFAPSTSAEEVNASRLTTVGVVNTALAGSDAPFALDAYTRPSDTSLVIRKPDGAYQVCAPVVRSFGDGVYQLTTGIDLPRYGVWPRLPSDIPEPTNASGAPVFIGAGSDDLGVRIYARIGFDTSSGIAVAPGTASSDPAGGNPFWTWWTRLP